MKYIVAVLVLCLSAFIYFFRQQDSDLVLRFYQSFGREPCSVLRGKVVWITGASSGIGRQLAYDLAACGCKLVLSARRTQNLEEVKKKCADGGSYVWAPDNGLQRRDMIEQRTAERALLALIPAFLILEINPSYDKDDDIMVLPLDVTSFPSHVELSNHVIQRFGRIDILVNNAGVISMFQYSENTSFDVEKKVLHTNLLGTISLTKAVLPHMLERKEGQIVFVSSIAGKIVVPGMAEYSASKFGAQAYFDTLRHEVSSRNINIVTVMPGPVVSDVWGSALTNDVNVAVKDTPAYDEFLKMLKDVELMPTERCTYLTLVAMVNNLKESWISTRSSLHQTYLAHYLHIM